MQRKLLLITVAMACSLPGCSKKPPSALPPPPSGSSGQSDAGEVLESGPGSQADFALRMNGQDTIYFETDRFNIDATDAIALQAQAAWLQQYPQKYAVIEGHADERGTREYNLALGERRAAGAKNYLESIGVGPGRISVVSYGKERPAALGSDESSWARNRRSVTITAD